MEDIHTVFVSEGVVHVVQKQLGFRQMGHYCFVDGIVVDETNWAKCKQSRDIYKHLPVCWRRSGMRPIRVVVGGCFNDFDLMVFFNL